NEIRALSRRVDASREKGGDTIALAGVERALVEIRGALRTLTPAEQLAGFDETIQSLGSRVDTIMRDGDDPGTVRQLEDTLAALRTVAATIASSETLERLSSDIHTLSSRIDQLAQSQRVGLMAQEPGAA